jgi:hypothetical protein
VTQNLEEERVRIGMIASAVVEEISRRYGVQPAEVMDALAWVREHKAFISKLKHSGYLTVLGTLIGASLLVAWEGVKAYLRKVVE